MKFVLIFIGIFCLANYNVNCLAPASCSTGCTRTIVSGDTLNNIASSCGITLSTLLSYNPQIYDANLIHPGDVICVPCGCGTTAAPSYAYAYNSYNYYPTSGCTSYYYVKSGDTCTSLLNAYPSLYSLNTGLNTGSNCNNLQVGQALCVGNTGYNGFNGYNNFYPVSGCTSYYYVKSGDTCTSIANAYSTTVNNLYSLNTGLSLNGCSSLQIGQAVCVSTAAYGGYSGWTGTNYYPVSNCNSYYYVKSGDTCTSILNSYPNLYNVNNGLYPYGCNNLQIGQPLCISNTGYIGNYYYNGYCGIAYTIKAGDTCYDIAKYYGFDVSTLQNCNPGINCYNLQVGQTIRV